MKRSFTRACWLLPLAVVACGSEPTTSPHKEKAATTTLKLTGALPGLRNPKSARAMAITSDGRSYSAPLNARSVFTLDLPTGRAYRVVIAHANARGDLSVDGHLVNRTSHGIRAWIGLRAAGAIDLGRVSPKASAAVKPKDYEGWTDGPDDGDNGDEWGDDGWSDGFDDDGYGPAGYGDDAGVDAGPVVTAGAGDAGATKDVDAGAVGAGGGYGDLPSEDVDVSDLCAVGDDAELYASNEPGDTCDDTGLDSSDDSASYKACSK